jgi:hypothetical protein
MSFRNKGRKFQPVSGKAFSSASGTVAESEGYDFKGFIAETLHKAFGGTARSIKTVMAYTDAGERTVKNWFEARNGPNGENLIELIRHSDEVLEAVLVMAGRRDILAGKLLLDSRDTLVKMLGIIDQLKADDPVDDPPAD